MRWVPAGLASTVLPNACQLGHPKWGSRSCGRGFAAVSRIFAGQSVAVGQFRQSSKYRSARPATRNQSPRCSPNANGRSQRHGVAAFSVILRNPGFTKRVRPAIGEWPDRQRWVQPDLAVSMLAAFLAVVSPPLAGRRGEPVGVLAIGLLPKGGPFVAVDRRIGCVDSLLSTMDVTIAAANPPAGRKSPARWREPPSAGRAGAG